MIHFEVVLHNFRLRDLLKKCLAPNHLSFKTNSQSANYKTVDIYRCATFLQKSWEEMIEHLLFPNPDSLKEI